MKDSDAKNIPIRISSALYEKIEEAAKRTGLPKQEIIRLCTAIGIEDLRRLNWDIAGVISKAANDSSTHFIVAKAAEEENPAPMPVQKPVKYSAKKRKA